MPAKKKSRTSASATAKRTAAGKNKNKVITPGKAKRKAAKPAAKRAAAKRVSLAFDPSIDNLNKIEHIVVLMMENRSFDHMLGYPKLTGARVTAANHVGGLLTESVPRPAIPVATYQNVIDKMAAWHSESFRERMLEMAENGKPHDLSEFQKQSIAAGKEIEKQEARAGRRSTQ